MQIFFEKKYNYEIKENQTPNPKEIWIQNKSYYEIEENYKPHFIIF
jgi:hypothetical protein